MRYEPDADGRYPLNREEYMAVRRMFGGFSTFIENYEKLSKRAKLGPKGLWRDMRMLSVKWQKILHGLCLTMPRNKLETLHKELDHTRVEVYVTSPLSGGKRHENAIYVPEEALYRVIDRAVRMDCFGCEKCGADVKNCPLRKDIHALFPDHIPARKDGYCEMTELEIPMIGGNTND